MNFTAAGFVTALIIAIPAALGGALIVFSEFDDAPGGMLIGLLLIVGAVAFGGRAARRGS